MAVELRGLEGKVALITGAGRGQGANHARAFAAAGCDIVALDICEPIPGLYDTADEEDLALTVGQVEQLDRRAVGVKADIRDEAQVKAAVERALAEFDRVDILVNNAAMASLDVIHEMPGNVLNAIIDTNIKGPMHTTKYVVPQMIDRRAGKIINISSATIANGNALLSHYIASKQAIVGLAKSWAYELAEFGINVNTVAPATIKPTDKHGSGMVPGLSKGMGMDPMEAFETFSAQGNFPGEKWRVEMQDITDAVLFLSSDNARMITGQTLFVDAGQATR